MRKRDREGGYLTEVWPWTIIVRARMQRFRKKRRHSPNLSLFLLSISCWCRTEAGLDWKLAGGGVWVTPFVLVRPVWHRAGQKMDLGDSKWRAASTAPR